LRRIIYSYMLLECTIQDSEHDETYKKQKMTKTIENKPNSYRRRLSVGENFVCKKWTAVFDSFI